MCRMLSEIDINGNLAQKGSNEGGFTRSGSKSQVVDMVRGKGR
jgi:hypothetical protein